MRSLLAGLVVALLVCATIGCTMFEKQKDNPRSTGQQTPPQQTLTAAQLVGYLNSQANRLQTLKGEATLTARTNLLGHTLNGTLAARQPRDFRMNGEHKISGSVDLGSNSDQFWVYVNAPTQKPLFVYASHTDFDAGKARLPDGIAFEPEWVMQSLGMHVFPSPTPAPGPTSPIASTSAKTVKYDEPRFNSADRTYTLSWQDQTPTHIPVLKEVVFDADDTRDPRDGKAKPQVRKHIIRDLRDSKQRVICTATVKSVGTAYVAQADANAPRVTVQYPTHIELKWEIEKFELDLTLSKVQVNQRFTDEQTRTWFSRPNPGVEAIDLARYQLSMR
jgi:hypothetical protein